MSEDTRDVKTEKDYPGNKANMGDQIVSKEPCSQELRVDLNWNPRLKM